MLLPSKSVPHSSSGNAAQNTGNQPPIGASSASRSLSPQPLAMRQRAPHVPPSNFAVTSPSRPTYSTPATANPPLTSNEGVFPKESMFMIQQKLQEQVQDHHSPLSLSYASHSVYNNVDPKLVEQIFERYPPASSQEHKVLYQRRAEFIRMLQRDGKFGKRFSLSDKTQLKLLCMDCAKPRPLSLFLVTAPWQNADQQRCLGHEGMMWICRITFGITTTSKPSETDRGTINLLPEACLHCMDHVLVAITQSGWISNPSFKSDHYLCNRNGANYAFNGYLEGK